VILVHFDRFDPSSIANHLVQATEDYEIAFWQFLKEYFDTSECFYSQTSGSTGEPKKIAIQKRHAVMSAEASIAYFDIQASHKLLLAMDIKYIGAKMLVIRAIVARASLIVVKPKAEIFSQLDWQLINKIDFVSLAPNQVYSTLDQNLEAFRHVSKVLIGGGVVSSALMRLIKKCAHTLFYESFGMTETISHFAIKPLDGLSNAFSVLDGFHVRTDSNGCLVVSHPFLLPREVVSQDMVHLIDDRHFEWMGRKDFVVLSGGVKIYPEIVEKELEKVLKCDFALVGIPDNALGECLALVYTDTKDEFVLIQEIKKIVSHPYFVPKKYRQVNQLEYTENGKIKRAPLKELFY
jgi:O-succinylbenzoic acid--CoA ligase